MSLTRDEFKASLLSFYDQQKNIQLNEWNWETVPVSSAVYLRKTNYLQANLEESEEDEPIEIFIKVEYHVAYSISYRVPTLYFQPSYYQGKRKLFYLGTENIKMAPHSLCKIYISMLFQSRIIKIWKIIITFLAFHKLNIPCWAHHSGTFIHVKHQH